MVRSVVGRAVGGAYVAVSHATLMSKASEELEQKTEGDVPTAGEVIAATTEEATDAVRRQRRQIEAGIRADPMRSIAIAAGVGFVAAVILRRL